MQTGSNRSSDFEEIVQRYHGRILSIACRMLGDMEEAKDMAQDAFIKLWNHGSNLAVDAAAFGFLARTVTNLCIDRLRRRKRRRFLSLETGASHVELMSPNDPAHIASSRQLVQLVLKTADRLKAKQKAVFVLRDVEGCSVRETAEILGCSENNVLVTLHIARKNLRKWLKYKLDVANAGGGEKRR